MQVRGDAVSACDLIALRPLAPWRARVRYRHFGALRSMQAGPQLDRGASKPKNQFWLLSMSAKTRPGDRVPSGGACMLFS